jgi:uncharacterized protein
MIRRSLIVVFCAMTAYMPLAAAPAVPAWRSEPPFSTETATIVVGGTTTIHAEIADTFETRARGLGNRAGLKTGWGMLFISSSATVQNFWMKDMRFCLDIIWIERGVITGAAENICPQPSAPDSELKVVSSGIPVTYVLEMPANWLKENGLGAGSTVVMTLPASA